MLASITITSGWRCLDLAVILGASVVVHGCHGRVVGKTVAAVTTMERG